MSARKALTRTDTFCTTRINRDKRNTTHRSWLNDQARNHANTQLNRASTLLQQPRDEHRRSTAKIRRPALPALTSLRFFAAFGIVLFHSRGYFGIPKDAEWVFWGKQPVSFFFILSGFILYYSYQSLDGIEGATRFYRARIARIWPLHALTMILAARARLRSEGGVPAPRMGLDDAVCGTRQPSDDSFVDSVLGDARDFQRSLVVDLDRDVLLPDLPARSLQMEHQLEILDPRLHRRDRGPDDPLQPVRYPLVHRILSRPDHRRAFPPRSACARLRVPAGHDDRAFLPRGFCRPWQNKPKILPQSLDTGRGRFDRAGACEHDRRSPPRTGSQGASRQWRRLVAIKCGSVPEFGIDDLRLRLSQRPDLGTALGPPAAGSRRKLVFALPDPQSLLRDFQIQGPPAASSFPPTCSFQFTLLRCWRFPIARGAGSKRRCAICSRRRRPRGLRSVQHNSA